MRKAIFFDRDGVINRDFGYVGTVDRFEFLPQVCESLAKLKKMGYALVLVTNQSGIARGMYTVDDFNKVTEYMQDELKKHDAGFDGIYFCPHHPNATVSEFRCTCTCRKPKPDMILWARDEYDLDLSNSIFVGDHASDIAAAKNAKVGGLVLVGEHIASECKIVPDAQCFEDLSQFVDALDSGNIVYHTYSN